MGRLTEDHIYCQGCGVQIQTESKEEAGYTPKSSLGRDNILCQRCFRLKHYNELQDVTMDDDDFLKMVSTIRSQKGLVVHLIDIFDVNGSLIQSLPRIIGDNPVILVGNKVDLIPQSVNQHQLGMWLRSMANEAGLKVKDVFLISSTKGHGMDRLAEQIEIYRQQKDVYIVGATNVGKSTFINRLINQSTGVKDVITTSYFPGTTLGFIEIPLDDQTAMFDTPGIVNEKQMVHYVSQKDLKIMTPDKEIKPRTYQLNAKQTLFFGGLARLDILRGEKQAIVCYFSNRLSIHRTKMEKADQLYADHLGELLSPPSEETLKTWPELTTSSFRIQNQKTDIVFPGLGWVSVAGEDITVTAYSPKGVTVSIRKALI